MEQEKTLLRHLRRDREISLDKLAADTGINVATLSRAERRLQTLTEDQSNTLGEYFGVPGDALLDDASKFLTTPGAAA